MDERLQRTLSLASLIAEAADISAYVAVAQIYDSYTRKFSLDGQWIGNEIRFDDPEMLDATIRVLELVKIHTDEPMIHDVDDKPGFASRIDNLVVSIAIGDGYRQQEAMLGAIMRHSLLFETRLHHVGQRFATEDKVHESSSLYTQYSGITGIVKPAEDHLRIYHEIYTNKSPNGRYYQEFQSAAPGTTVPAVHLDVAVYNPELLLRAVAAVCKTTAEFWEAGPNDPVGAVWISDGKGVPFGLMARSNWTPVLDW